MILNVVNVNCIRKVTIIKHTANYINRLKFRPVAASTASTHKFNSPVWLYWCSFSNIHMTSYIS